MLFHVFWVHSFMGHPVHIIKCSNICPNSSASPLAEVVPVPTRIQTQPGQTAHMAVPSLSRFRVLILMDISLNVVYNFSFQCVTTSGSGACPDMDSNPTGSDDVTVAESSNADGIITISYTRALDTGSTVGDQVIPTDQEVYIAWSVGPINPDGRVAKHRMVCKAKFLLLLCCPQVENLKFWVGRSIIFFLFFFFFFFLLYRS